MGMGIVVNHNLSAMNANRQMGINQSAMSKSLEKLSSGLKINRAADDASGLSISEKMRAQIRGLDQASSNAQDGISLIQTADGNLNETEDILQRIRELAVKGATGTLAEEDSEAVQDEVKALLEEVDRIGNTTEFNTKKLLNGELAGPEGVSVGANQTVGAQVAKLDAGKVSGTFSLSALASATDAFFAKETIKIDGTDIVVDWGNLTQDEKSILAAAKADGSESELTNMNKAKDLIVSKINEAIDASGGKVEHVSGYVTGNAGARTITLESGSKGVNSSIELASSTTTTGVMHVAMGKDKTDSLTGIGKTNYNGVTIATSEEFDFSVNGKLISKVGLSAVIDTTVSMNSAASILQSALNATISTYNESTGKEKGQDEYIQKVTVNVSDDGRFVVNSESGEVTLTDRTGFDTVQKLGLTDAQTSASANGGMTLQIGANKGQTMTFGIEDMRTAALGLNGVDLSTQTGSSNALEKLDTAIKKVSKQRSQLGAAQTRLEHTIKNLDTSSENLQSAESRIRDTDMSKEMMNYTKLNILSQAAQSMLAQANQAPQGVLQLLQ